MEHSSDPIPEADEANQPMTRGDERRHSLVVAAYQLIAEKGFEGLRVRDVAARVGDHGINIATLHYYFKTKDALIQGVVDYLIDRFSSVNAPLAAGAQQDPAEQVRQMFVDVQYQLQHMPDMFVVLTELHLHARRNPAVRASMNGMLQTWRDHVEGVCRAGIEQGLFPADLDIPRTATILMALTEGLTLRAIAGLEYPPLEPIGTEMADWLTRWRTK